MHTEKQTEKAYHFYPRCIFENYMVDVMKKCPYCAEDIQNEAIKCKHCGEWLEKPSLKSERQISVEDVEGIVVADDIYENKPSDVSMRLRPRPWIRYWARFFDTTVSCGVLLIIFFFGLAYFFPNAYMKLIDVHTVFIGMGIVFCWIFIEGFIISVTGTTPGKWLLGVKVRNPNETQLSYEQSFKRSQQVWFNGMGLGIPIVNLFAMYFGYKWLMREGKSFWDQEGDFIVIHEKLSSLKIAIYISLIFAFFIFMGELKKGGIY